MKKTKSKQGRGGFHFINEEPYLRVTKILSVIDKSAPLMYWFGKIVWESMVADPSLSWEDARGKPYGENARAKDRGTAVHSLVENFKKTGDIEELGGNLNNYAKAFEQWVIDFDVVVQENERRVVSEKYKYAGTLDLLAVVGDDLRIVDVKTGKDLYNEVHLQTSAYRHALEENGVKVETTSALLLKADGTYKYQINRDEFEAFLSAQKLWVGLNRSLCDKVGYEKR